MPTSWMMAGLLTRLFINFFFFRQDQVENSTRLIWIQNCQIQAGPVKQLAPVEFLVFGSDHVFFEHCPQGALVYLVPDHMSLEFLNVLSMYSWFEVFRRLNWEILEI